MSGVINNSRTWSASFKKRPNDGKMKGITFAQDLDAYWIEIFNNKPVSEIF